MTTKQTKPSKLTELAAQKAADNIPDMSRQSFKWLADKISKLKNMSAIPNAISKENFRRTNQFKLGRLYYFYYNPKGKDSLPYYDKFPLVLALEKYPDGFLGLNLHYLPIKYRMVFLNKLMQFAVHNEAGEIQRMRVTYDILSATRRFREFRPCLKRYLHGHIQSKILAVQPNEWEIATYLPIQKFKGAMVNEVWQDSIHEVKEN